MIESKPHITMVTNVYHPVIGGITNYIESLAKGLNKEGYSVEVVSYPPKLVIMESGGLNYSVKTLFHVLFAIYVMLRTLVLRARHKKIIIHGHSANFCLLAAVLCKIIGCKGIHTFHSPVRKSDFILRRISPRADAILFVSPPHMNSYLNIGKVTNKRIVMAPGAVDTEYFYPVSENEKRELRKKYHEFGFEMDAAIVLFLGRLVEDKGVHVLIDSTPIIRKEIPNLQMMIGGSSPDTPDARQYYQRLENQVREMNLGEWIMLRPNLPHQMIPELYRLSDVFTCPSLWSEPSPISVVEALASGVPVVASETGGLPDRVRDGVDGFIVKANDATALGNRIAQILSNEKLKKELSMNARNEAQKNYSLHQFTSRHIKLYDSLFK